MGIAHGLSAELRERFQRAVTNLDQRFGHQTPEMADEHQEATVREWLDASGALPWAGEGVTADEWFFITTLYGEMTLDGQRTHIRAFFPRFVELAHGDVRNCSPALLSDWKLRSGWMKSRLCRMAQILNERQLSMGDYVTHLQRLEASADLLVVGAYPPGGEYDECRGSLSEYGRARRSIPDVPVPQQDPVFGRDGPLPRLWR